MKVEDLVVGRVYWSAEFMIPITIASLEVDSSGGLPVKKHYKNGDWDWAGYYRFKPSDKLLEITTEQLAEFGLEQASTQEQEPERACEHIVISEGLSFVSQCEVTYAPALFNPKYFGHCPFCGGEIALKEGGEG